MSNPELIQRLVADLDAPTIGAPAVPVRLVVWTALSALASLAMVVLLLKLSPHLANGPSPSLLFGVGAAAALALGALYSAVKLSYPEGNADLRWLALPLAILAAGVVLEMARSPRNIWSSQVFGHNPLLCFLLVVALSLPVFVAVLFALRAGATTHPRRSGAMAGLVAGGIGSALFTLHCPVDSLLFAGTWHALAVLAVTACGALAGSRILRW